MSKSLIKYDNTCRYRIYDKTIRGYKYWNNYDELIKGHEYEVEYYIGSPNYMNSNILRIKDIIPNAHIIFYNHLNKELEYEISSGLKKLRISSQLNFENRTDSYHKLIEQDLIKLLKFLPSDLEYLNLYGIIQDIKIYSVLPPGLKKYTTIKYYNEDLDNLPNTLEYLSVSFNNEEELSNKYNFNFLPITLNTLILKIPDRDYIIPELCHLPPNLKVLEIDNYMYSLTSLPSSLEKLIISHYWFLEDVHILPSNLKILQITTCNDLNIPEYPPTLEYLDIHIKVDLTKLPLSVKGLGLYNFNLKANTPEIPLNINTIYTNDEEIKQIPAHIKRVIIIRQDLGNIMTARIGDVSFEMDTFNREEAFFNNKK
jgi:hypothetical protein